MPFFHSEDCPAPQDKMNSNEIQELGFLVLLDSGASSALRQCGGIGVLGCLSGVGDCLLSNQGFSSEQRDAVFLHGGQDRFVPCLQGYICRQMPWYEWVWTPHPQSEAFPSPCCLEDPQSLLQDLDREEPAKADVSVSSARILKSGQGSESDRGTVVLRLQSVRKKCCQPQPSRYCCPSIPVASSQPGLAGFCLQHV